MGHSVEPWLCFLAWFNSSKLSWWTFLLNLVSRQSWVHKLIGHNILQNVLKLTMPSFQPLRKYNKFHLQTAEIMNDKNKKMEPKLIIQVLEFFNDYSFKNLFQFAFYLRKIQYKY